MRRYDDPVEVRKGWIGGPTTGMEGPEQFVWHGRLWQVRAVLAHWVETGAWWRSPQVQAVLGSESHPDAPAPDGAGAPFPQADPMAERELWRVEAGRGRDADSGVFDLSFDWSAGSWQLVGCVD